MTLVTIRAAKRDDYPAFARLFREMGVEDPTPSEARFVSELCPTTLMAEDADGAILGYTYVQFMRGTAYVRNVVAAPEARRRGVGRALLEAVATRARNEGCDAWCLNVKPDNVAAIRLYEAMGLVRAYEASALRIDWDTVLRAPELPAETRVIVREDDERVESEFEWVPGQLAVARASEGRVLLMTEERGVLSGATVFHPHFPGVYPFRVTRSDLAVPFIKAIRPYSKASDPFISVMVEGQPEVAMLLLALGASERMKIVHMKGHLIG